MYLLTERRTCQRRQQALSGHRSKRTNSRNNVRSFPDCQGALTPFSCFGGWRFAMKRTTCFLCATLLVGTFLPATIASAQTDVRSPRWTSPSADSAPRPTSSNRWESLPRMTAYRCLAEALGTASDPATGAPVRAMVDPQTGKPLCRPDQPNRAEGAAR